LEGMKRFSLGLCLAVALGATSASAEMPLICEGQARLEWTTCELATPAHGSQLVLRECYGQGLLGTFTGEVRLLVRANDQGDGYAQAGDGEPHLLLAMQGCYEGSAGAPGEDRFVGDLTMYVQVRGHGYFSFTAYTR